MGYCNGTNRAETMGVDLPTFCRTCRLWHGHGLGITRNPGSTGGRLVVPWPVCNSVFNVFLGEELLFRGALLPKMEGVFGRWSWVANGVLFAFYHVHQPWVMAENIVSGAILAYPSWRFRSTWMAVIVHSVQNVFFGLLLLGIILGLA